MKKRIALVVSVFMCVVFAFSAAACKKFVPLSFAELIDKSSKQLNDVTFDAQLNIAGKRMGIDFDAKLDGQLKFKNWDYDLNLSFVEKAAQKDVNQNDYLDTLNSFYMFGRDNGYKIFEHSEDYYRGQGAESIDLYDQIFVAADYDSDIVQIIDLLDTLMKDVDLSKGLSNIKEPDSFKYDTKTGKYTIEKSTDVLKILDAVAADDKYINDYLDGLFIAVGSQLRFATIENTVKAFATQNTKLTDIAAVLEQVAASLYDSVIAQLPIMGPVRNSNELVATLVTTFVLSRLSEVNALIRLVNESRDQNNQIAALRTITEGETQTVYYKYLKIALSSLTLGDLYDVTKDMIDEETNGLVSGNTLDALISDIFVQIKAMKLSRVLALADRQINEVFAAIKIVAAAVDKLNISYKIVFNKTNRLESVEIIYDAKIYEVTDAGIVNKDIYMMDGAATLTLNATSFGTTQLADVSALKYV